MTPEGAKRMTGTVVASHIVCRASGAACRSCEYPPDLNFFCNSGHFFLLERSDRELFPPRTRAEEKQRLGARPVKTSHSLMAANHSVGHGKRSNSRAPFVLPRSDSFWQDRSMRSVRSLSLLRVRDRLPRGAQLQATGRHLFYLRRTQTAGKRTGVIHENIALSGCRTSAGFFNR